MTRKLAGLCVPLALAAGFAACNQEAAESETEEFRNGVPRTETILMAVPGGAAKGQALQASNDPSPAVEATSQALLGEKAEWYTRTHDVTTVVNGAAFVVGGLVEHILKFPPTSLQDNQAVWGPWEEPLEPVAWKFTITRVADHTFQYAFDGRPKADPNAAFVTVLAGTHTPAVDAAGRTVARFGSGSFTLDWDARATLPQPPDDNVGKVDYSYEHLSADDTVDIKANFRQVKDEDRPGQRVDANYAFAQQPKGSGSMDFVFTVPQSVTETGGRGLVRSRWQWSGAGRSDVQLKSLDGTLVLSESECWDTGYLSVYWQDSWLSGKGWGSESSCAFPTAEYSTLQ